MKMSLLTAFTPMRFVSFLVVITACCHMVQAQTRDRKNTILLNVSNPLIFGKSFVVGYERLVGKNQSFSVGIGTTSIPSLINVTVFDSVKLLSEDRRIGFHVSGDYRFYLKKVNLYDAPRGVYIGPYYGFSHIGRSYEWEINTETFQGNVNADTKLVIHNAGVELGYQFVFWDRLAVDFVLLGPGIGFYKVQADMEKNIEADEKTLVYKTLNRYLEKKLPGFSQLIQDGSFEETGKIRKTGIGLRYSVNIGFRF